MRFNHFALFAAVVAAGAITTPAFAGGADLALLPGSGSLLLHVDLTRLRSSGLYKEVVEPLLKNPNLQKEMGEAQKALGFDPINDLASLTMVMNPPAGPGEPEVLMVLEGKINKVKLLEMAQKEGKAVKGEHAGVELWASPPGGNDEMAVAFIGDKLVIGKPNMVRETIDASKNKGGGLNAGLAALAKDVNQGADVWFVGNLPAEALAQLAMGEPLAKDVKTVMGSLDLSKGLALNLALGATPEAAKALAAKVQTALKLDPQTEPMMAQMGVLPIIKKTRAEAKGANLNIGIDLDPADISALKMFVGMMGMGMMGGPPAPAAPPPVENP